jgi:hypothetical protein
MAPSSPAAGLAQVEGVTLADVVHDGNRHFTRTEMLCVHSIYRVLPRHRLNGCGRRPGC